ncbi:hypothetical protein, partial [Idiomarina xiamenensis]
SAILILKKSKKSIPTYLVGWIVICLTPFIYKLEKLEDLEGVLQLSSNLLFGLVIFFYLILIKKLRYYFEN